MEESVSMEIQLATASINKDDELVIEIREMFERPKIQSIAQCCIYKVPHYLRKLNEEAYTPQVISIGLFHHKSERLKAIEEHKDRYFQSFVERSEIKLEYLVDTISEMEESIRGCYAETIDLTSDWFVKMILVDASFILELLFRCSLKGLTSDDPMAGEPRANDVMLDLLFLENQLPFFVIEKLFNLSFPSLSNNHLLLELSFSYFRDFNMQFIKPSPNVKILK